MIHSAIRVMMPFVLAAAGGLFSEMAGVLNIALEGLILIGAFFGVYVGASTGSGWMAVTAAAAAAGLLGLLYGAATLRLRANVFVAGIATNLLAAGLTVVLADRIWNQKGVVRFADFPPIPQIVAPAAFGEAGRVLLEHSVLVPVGWALVILAGAVVRYTPFGLRLRAVGQDPLTAAAAGINPDRYRIAALAISGLFCGMAGALLALPLRAFVPNVSAGRGWMALVIIYLGGRRFGGVVAAAALFGLAESLSNAAQGMLAIPSQIILTVPYVVSLAALVATSLWSRRARVESGRREREL